MPAYKASDFRVKRAARWAKAFSQKELRSEFETRGGDPDTDGRIVQMIAHDILLRRLKSQDEKVPNHARKEIATALRICFELGARRPYAFTAMACHPLGTLNISSPEAAGEVFDELARRINQGMIDDFRNYGVLGLDDLSASFHLVPALVWAWRRGHALAAV